MAEVIKRDGYVKMVMESMYGDVSVQIFHHQDPNAGFQSAVIQLKGPWQKGWDPLYNLSEDLEELAKVLENL